MSGIFSLVVPAHNDRTLLVNAVLRDNQGRPAPYDLTDCRIELYIKANSYAADPAPIDGVVTDAVNGEGEVSFSTGDPGMLWRRIDIVRIDTGQRITIDAGPLVVEAA